MTTKVGEGYIEVETRLDNDSLRRAQAQFARNFFSGINDTINKNVNENLDRNLGKRITTSIASAFKRGFRDAEKSFKNSSRNIHRHVDRDSFSWGQIAGQQFGKAFEGIMSLMPARLETIFTRTGPIIGTALLTALAGALAIGMPAIGAMASGLFFAGFGFGGAIAAAIVGAINDPRVKSALGRLKDTFMSKIVNAPETQKIGAILATQIDKVAKALNRWAPAINSILNAGAKFLGPITDGFIGFMDAVLPAFDRMMNSPFLTQLIKITADGLKLIGQALGESFDRFLKDPQAMAGATRGLKLFFSIIAGGIKTLFDFLRGLSRMWEKLNTPDKSGKSPLDKMRDGWKSIKEILDAIVHAGIVNVFKDLKNVFNDLKPVWEAIVGGFKALGDWLKNPENEKKLTRLVEIFLALKVAALGYSAALKAVNAGQALFAATGGLGAAGKGTKGQKFGNAGSGGLTGGILGMFLGGGANSASGAAGGLIGGLPGALAGIAVGELIKALIPADAKKRIDDEWKNIASGNMKAYWNQIKQDWDKGWGRIKNWWTNTLIPFFSNLWRTIWTGAKNWFNTSWAQIQTEAGGALARLKASISNVGAGISKAWDFIWAHTVGMVITRFQQIKTAVTQGISFVRDRINGILDQIKAGWNTRWQWVKDRFGGILAIVKAYANAAIGWVRDRINGILEQIKSGWNTRWGSIKDRFGGILAIIKGYANAGISWVRDRIAGVLKVIQGNWGKVWQGIGTVLGAVWGGIVKSVGNGINGVLGIINKGIGIINKALGALGVGFRIPTLAFVGQGSISAAATAAAKIGAAANGGLLVTRAAGGRMYGPGTTTSDSIPSLLSKDEYVIKAKSAKSIGYNTLDMLNAHGSAAMNNFMSQRFAHGGHVLGFAVGGRVGAANNALLNEHRNHLHVAMQQGVAYILALARQSGLPFHPTSTFRPGDPLFHGKGKAVDFGGFNQDKLAAWFMSHRNGLLEVIHRTVLRDYAVFVGGGGGGGSVLSGIFAFLGRGWKWVMEHMLAPAGKKAIDMIPEKNAVSAFGKGWVKALFNQATGKAKGEFDNAQKMMAAGNISGGGGGVARWAGVVTTALRMLGLPGNWLKGVLARMNQESGGNPRAINNWDSNAKKGDPSRGLMQTIGSTFRAYALPGFNKDIYDPLSNVLAALRYIKARYGSVYNLPSGGYAGGGRVQLFDQGGVWPSGTAGMNLSGKSEVVLTNTQWEAMKTNVNSNHTVNVYVDGVLHKARIEIEESDRELVRDLYRGYR